MESDRTVKSCFEYGLYYSPVVPPRRLSAAFPYRIEQVSKAGQNY